VVANLNVDVIEILKEPLDSVLAAPSTAQPVDLALIRFKEATKNRWPTLMKKAVPFYPDDAKSRRVQGTVNLKAIIGPDGHIESLEVVDGPFALRQAAVGAVRQWVYRPCVVMGAARRVQVELHVIFSMG
jgi:TonB family protein